MNAIFTGRKRRGKTTLAFDMAVKSGGGVIIFDPKREFRGWPATVSDVSQLESAVKEKHRIVVYHPNGDTEQAFIALGEWIISKHDAAMQKGWDRAGYHFTLLIDEASQLQNPSRINEQLKRILAQCRPEIINVYQTVQSPADTFRASKVCNSDWFLFQTTHVADLERIEGFAGREVAAIVSRLDYHEYVHFSEDDSSYEIVKDGESWYRSIEFQKNENESEDEEMAKRDGSIRDLIPDWVLDLLEDDGYEIVEKSPRSRERESGRRERDRDDERGGERGSERGTRRYRVYERAS